MAIFLHRKRKKSQRLNSLDLMLASRKEVTESTILTKKKSRIEIIDFKKVDFNKLKSLRNKFTEKLVKESQLTPTETILRA